MNVYREQLRAGSGHILVQTLTDGPTRLLKLTNIASHKTAHSPNSSLNSQSDNQPHNSALSHQIAWQQQQKSIEVYVNLTGGIGISFIKWSMSQDYEELVYAYLKHFELSFHHQSGLEQKLLLGIQSIQMCNQLINALKSNVLVVQNKSSPQTRQHVSGAISKDLALKIDYLRKYRPANNNDNVDDHYHVYIEHLVLSLANVNLQIEERLLWKIIQFFEFDGLESRSEVSDSI